MAPVWRAEVADYVVSPLAADARRLYVATRDGRVTAFDQASATVSDGKEHSHWHTHNHVHDHEHAHDGHTHHHAGGDVPHSHD